MLSEGQNQPSIDTEPKPQDRLRALAQSYLTQEFVISGVNEAAVANNRGLVEVIKTAGDQLVRDHANDVFSINLGGSRIQGTNTVDSDADVLVIVPEEASSESNSVYEALTNELKRRGFNVQLDGAMGMFVNFSVKTNPREFIYTVDHERSDLLALFGNALASNPNLLLARLAALEVINQYSAAFPYDWKWLAQDYAKTYLGERPHVIEKLAERHNMPKVEVGKIFTSALFQERYRKFGLKDPKIMLQELREWRKQNLKQLEKLRMNKTYKGVMEALKDSY